MCAAETRRCPIATKMPEPDSPGFRFAGPLGRGTSTSEVIMATFTDRARELTRGRSHTEGGLAKPIEEVTAALPSDTFLWLAYGAGAFSIFLKLRGRNHDALMAG